MTPEHVVTLGRQALEMMLTVSAPVLLVALMIGLVVSLLQAVTQINEATLTFLPKMVAITVTLMAIGPWMLTMLTDYIARTLQSIPQIATGG
ncbi:MAG TPA: flagellar biosynthesis protein FliQ [Quisquiliibacterium sp.]|nr:flagellar biosynthesis protein FliQ [Quisquiliibacterium sp.]HPA89691.1 flagellar biosynthesis protein FliQ [Quisquiliibacterium sp.]HQD84189.1 flagellar biosynthesis protein FliQ [Quisquiliibacterium sp.]HQN10677.1 flagellar biosynthesis protein FliQ [Quisquiliibacterium sp.]HQP66285.1 flagellar biosynthesis protein FliQ [Quisquiliibacterium sp.]